VVQRVPAPLEAVSMTEGLSVIRTPNRGVVAAGAALGSVGVLIGVLGGSAAQASAKPAVSAAKAFTVAPNQDTAGQQRIAAERRTVTAQAAAVAAAAGATSTAKPKPKPKAKPKHVKAARAARAKKRVPLTPRETARALVAEHDGWKPAQFTCLDKLWTRESGWDPREENNSSGAYGIPQSLPASKMASFGSDWRTNPTTQIKWGLSYIADRYETPCAAWEHSQRYNYY
jgi:hypothetical protein